MSEPETELDRGARRAARNLEEIRAKTPPLAMWLALDALIARIDASEERHGIIFAERIKWAEETARRLVRQHGAELARSLPQAMHVCNRFGIQLR
jgi:hypothetical protein